MGEDGEREEERWGKIGGERRKGEETDNTRIFSICSANTHTLHTHTHAHTPTFSICSANPKLGRNM